MNALANAPAPGPIADLPVVPVAAVAAVTEAAASVVPSVSRWTWPRAKDTLVSIYAYGLLAFGMFGPLLLAAWYAFFGPAGQ